tara:strand:- start:329 stop:592 length:264 start_codon:yes stop_codon:yes gene_type:complete
MLNVIGVVTTVYKAKVFPMIDISKVFFVVLSIFACKQFPKPTQLLASELGKGYVTKFANVENSVAKSISYGSDMPHCVKSDGVITNG